MVCGKPMFSCPRNEKQLNQSVLTNSISLGEMFQLHQVNCRHVFLKVILTCGEIYTAMFESTVHGWARVDAPLN